MEKPVVELDGDEMTRIIWKKIREEVSFSYICDDYLWRKYYMPHVPSFDCFHDLGHGHVRVPITLMLHLVVLASKFRPLNSLLRPRPYCKYSYRRRML